MDYITAEAAAAKWDVTPRQVQRLLADGRIPGAQKYGRAWMIPANTAKPGDPRREKQSPLNTLAISLPGTVAAIYVSAPRARPDAVLKTVGEARLRRVHEGALAYARGDFARTMACYRQNEGDTAAQLCAASLAIAATISTGNYALYSEIESFLNGVAQTNTNSGVISFAELALAGGYLGAMAPNMVPDWLKNGDFSALPNAAKPDAAYKRVKFLQCLGDTKTMLAVGETALSFCHAEHEISFHATYLTLLCAAACCALGREEEAERYLLTAMRANLPNGFVTPFAEHIPLYGGLMETLLKREYPQHLDAILSQHQRTFTHWLAFHNRFTKENITLILPLRDYQIALLAARHIPGEQIAKQFNLSVGRLKNKLNEIYGKLLVNNRDELAKIIL